MTRCPRQIDAHLLDLNALGVTDREQQQHVAVCLNSADYRQKRSLQRTFPSLAAFCLGSQAFDLLLLGSDVSQALL
ncbi:MULTISPECIES: hypothetical protein [unclassified Streptomyces]|uniref:hypothetical protein n=1 Tax=unclassified Streptomyces TaxID=2593676 RepID=UPI002DDA0A36|nr:hypothetical protein [Streptomyces sp. NBC_01761]WSC51135.1 hypothetical protein OG808_01435 [Streptomyces sp. NBC_01761]WSF81971.1 hypothetical protein OIE70_01460 [Streptomyces sp. NBC_01744]